MVKLAVFDLNQTLYTKSSKEEFFKYICYRQNYKLLNIFRLLFFKAIGKLRALNQTEFKENFFRYLNNLPPEQVQAYAAEYWSVEYPKYFNKQLLERVEALRAKDVRIVVATGALELYAAPLFDRFPVDYYCGTRTTYENGRHLIDGEACKDEEKLRRLDEHYGKGKYHIVEAYSDAEEMMLDVADRAYLIEDGQVRPLTAV